jgi:hypothetical protein
MDIKREILKRHSLHQARKVADYVGDNPARFKSLLQVFLDGPFRITQMAAWPLNFCVEANPDLIKPYFPVIFKTLDRTDIHNAVKRNILRMLQFTAVPVGYHGKLAERAFTFLQDHKEPVAVKVFAMTLLADLAVSQPDLKPELRIMIEDQLPYSSPAFVSRARKLMKNL